MKKRIFQLMDQVKYGNKGWDIWLNIIVYCINRWRTYNFDAVLQRISIELCAVLVLYVHYFLEHIFRLGQTIKEIHRMTLHWSPLTHSTHIDPHCSLEYLNISSTDSDSLRWKPVTDIKRRSKILIAVWKQRSCDMLWFIEALLQLQTHL